MIDRSIALALALALVGCGAAAHPESMPVPPIAHDAKPVVVNPLLARMARVRELEALRDVPTVVMSRAELIAKLEAHVAREVPKDEIAGEETFLKLLGIIGPDESYELMVYDALRTSTGGMYEPFDGKMYLPDDLAPDARAETRAHEFVHALQDQHFNLAALEKYAPGASDLMLARSCLAEGDATSATHEGEEIGSNAVTYVEREISAPYVTGTAFVRALRERGGWREVDRAWTHGALTTEQVLHPEKWFAAEVAETVPAPTVVSLGSDFARTWVDVRGELALRLVLESAVPARAAADAASGWAGDTAMVARSANRVALAWRLRWDDEAHARAAQPTLSLAFASGRTCMASVTRDGRDVLVIVGPEHSDCALLGRWSKEILGH